MKKYMLLSVLLVIVNAMVPSDKSKEGEFLKLVTDKAIKPCVVGFKKFTAQDLLALEEKYREVLNKTANPSYIERCFGMDNHTVSSEKLEEIQSLPDKVKAGMHLEVLPIKGSFCINGCCKRPNGCCVPGSSFGPTEVGAIGGLIGTLALISVTAGTCAQNSWFALLLIPAAAAPFCGCASGECAACVYYRCCAEREIWSSNVTK